MKIQLLSENTLLILAEQVISDDNFNHILQLHDFIQKNHSVYCLDCVLSYASIHITFNLLKISTEGFLKKIEISIREFESVGLKAQKEKVINIPVYYGLDVGLDLNELAREVGLSTEEVIKMHSDKFYRVYSIGFLPGFAYLGTVDEKIAVARRKTPRSHVPKGSLGIAGFQTAIYPLNSPSGWQIIGRTPMELIDYSQRNITPLSIGDQVKFSAISQSEFLELGGAL